VTDFSAIFRRAFGLHAAFGDLPGRDSVAGSFLRHHHVFADALFKTWMEIAHPPRISPQDFPFDLYASGEYAKLLETEWGA
jgi:hypothetical protein